MLPVEMVDCAHAGSRLKVAKLIHKIKANQNRAFFISFLLLLSTRVGNGPGDKPWGREYSRSERK
jgi:hypothetical protein